MSRKAKNLKPAFSQLTLPERGTRLVECYKAIIANCENRHDLHYSRRCAVRAFNDYPPEYKQQAQAMFDKELEKYTNV